MQPDLREARESIWFQSSLSSLDLQKSLTILPNTEHRHKAAANRVNHFTFQKDYIFGF